MSDSNCPTHFTYAPIDSPQSDLCQGDILEPSCELRRLFEDVHPHFINAKYSGFLILTQTCDLVRRGKKPCKSSYINLAVFRPLADVLRPLLDKCCKLVIIHGVIAPGLYLEKTRDTAQQLLSRIVNQNARAEGIFYLHPDAAVRIAEPCVALLQVNVAVKTEHYDKLLRARTGRLHEQFQSKLGWLLGYLYSRVATKDLSRTEQRDLIQRHLDTTLGGPAGRPYWIAGAKVKLADKSGVRIDGQSTAEIIRLINQYEPKAPQRIAIDRAIETIRDILPDIPKEQLQRVDDRLAADPEFKSACKS